MSKSIIAQAIDEVTLLDYRWFIKALKKYPPELIIKELEPEIKRLEKEVKKHDN